MTRLAILLYFLLLLVLTACAPSTAVVPGDCDECDDTDVVDTGTPADADTDTDADSDTDSDADSDADSDSDTDADTDVEIDEDGDGYIDEPEYDCDDTDAAVNPGATETCNGIDDDCDGEIDESLDCDGDDEPQLTVTVTAPGGLEYGSMICHVEYLEDADSDGSLSDEFVGWEKHWVENWVSSTTLVSNPGVIDAIRLNCTLCPDELTLAEEPSSPEAEAMGCTWTAVNGSGSTNGSVATWYFDETFSSSLVSVAGGTSVLVDLR